ncbi:MAG TPA: cupin domain-containing protein [Candidatus Sulfotelmatobacter sp.]|nr:cupin domain-containing protein [Candidatus Sulfotelmatobacter sp.]
MKQMLRVTVLAISGLLVLHPFCAQQPLPKPLTLSLECNSGDCPLLQGVPQTAGLRSGFVRLNPGETVGWHSTTDHEEALVILRGGGEARIEGRPARPFIAPAMVYIPPVTRHNIANTGRELLEYVYVVAPTAAQPAQPQTN